MRAAHCMVRLHNTTQNVDSNLCEDAGLPTPPTIQKCGIEDCPRWVPGNWSLCEESRCFTWNTGILVVESKLFSLYLIVSDGIVNMAEDVKYALVLIHK